MNNRERNLLILLGVIVVGAGLWYFGLPLWNHYVSLDEKVASNVRKIRQAQQKVLGIEGLVEDLREIRGRLRRVRQQLPEQGEFYSLMARLEEEARQVGISEDKIVTFERTGTRDRQFVREMVVRAQFRDLTLDQITRLLWRFNTRVPRLQVKSFDRFNLSMKRTDDGQRFDLRFDLLVYTLRPSDAPQEST